MSYELITKFDSRNFTPAASVPATYGRRRTIDSITIHWWGLPEWNATFFGTVDFLCTNKKPTSAHEVIEAGRVAVIVNHGDASWAAGNATGNATSIHLELNPRASDEDYATAAERIRDIRAMHGKDLPLIPHRNWQATMCPGDYDLARLDRMARGSAITTQGTTNTEGFLMALSDDEQRQILAAANRIMYTVDQPLDKVLTTAHIPTIADAVVNRDIPWFGFDGNQPQDGRTTTTLAVTAGYADSTTIGLHGAIAGLKELVTQLSVKQGVTIDYAAIAKAVNDDQASRMAE